jgi:hypothetical protein
MEQLADGIVFEWGVYTCPTEIQGVSFPFPYAFPHGVFGMTATFGDIISPTNPVAIGLAATSTAQFVVTCSASTPGSDGFQWLAIGD